ncbi:SMI1/KNR4 family protein [Streptomyces lunaelactis]|nr:SMI1/KNR4 family protein [Streptomyces lunaelactis]NUK76189.1 SMI1/KNR4 family protein [Streptomyces lunaelactis]
MPAVARFDEVKAALWSSGTYGVQPPLTDEVAREAEQVLDLALPFSLLDLLRVQNGGEVSSDWNAFPTAQPTSWSADHVPFSELMGIGHRELTASLLATPYLVEEWDLPSPIVLISGDGHYWIALDYRECGRRGEPSVIWLDADLDSELQLAVDFRSFIEGLTSVASCGSEVIP